MSIGSHATETMRMDLIRLNKEEKNEVISRYDAWAHSLLSAVAGPLPTVAPRQRRIGLPPPAPAHIDDRPRRIDGVERFERFGENRRLLLDATRLTQRVPEGPVQKD